MALIKREYIDNETLITAQNLNDIQDAVIMLEDGLFSVDNDKNGEVITITDAAHRGFRRLNIYGKTTQDGTPTPDNPVDLVSVGDSGIITVNVTGENDEQSMTISTPNGLPGIPVKSGGNYTDANGQQWICDEIDFVRGKIIRHCGHYIFDGTEEWKAIAAWNNGTRYTRTSIERSKLQYDSSILCNIGMGKDWTAGEYILFVNEYVNFVVGGDALMGAEDVNSFKAILAEKPIELLYKLATPIETPLSEDELAAYASLYTYKDSTTVSNDAGAYMSLEYVMDAKKYIERLIGTGGSGGSAAWLTNVTLKASAWVGSDSLYSQIVTIDGITEYSKVDLLPSPEQLAVFHNKDVAFVTENEDGVVTVYAIGDKPTLDYTIQAQITEVSV